MKKQYLNIMRTVAILVSILVISGNIGSSLIYAGEGNMIMTKATLWDINANGFKDLVGSSKWYVANANKLFKNENNIIHGYPDGTFRGENKLTVEEFITMVVRANGWGDELESLESFGKDATWSAPYIAKAIEKGILEEGKFLNYSKDLTRENMGNIIVESVTLLDEYKIVKINEAISTLEIKGLIGDINDISINNRVGVYNTYKLGIITGYPEGVFGPKRVLTRAEATAVVLRMIDPDERIDLTDLVNISKGDYSAFMVGGSKWVDPVETGTYDNSKRYEDIVGDNDTLMYYPRSTGIDNDVEGHLDDPNRISDYINLALNFIKYKEPLEREKMLNQVRLVLGSRLEADELYMLMAYLSKKDGSGDITVFERKKFTYENSTDEEKMDYREVFYFSRYRIEVAESANGGGATINPITGVRIEHPFSYGRVKLLAMSRGDSTANGGLGAEHYYDDTYTLIDSTIIHDEPYMPYID